MTDQANGLELMQTHLANLISPDNATRKNSEKFFDTVQYADLLKCVMPTISRTDIKDSYKTMLSTMIKNRLPRDLTPEQTAEIKLHYETIMDSYGKFPVGTFHNHFTLFQQLLDPVIALMQREGVYSKDEQIRFVSKAFSKITESTEALDSVIGIGILTHSLHIINEMTEYTSQIPTVVQSINKIVEKLLEMNLDNIEQQTLLKYCFDYITQFCSDSSNSKLMEVLIVSICKIALKVVSSAPLAQTGYIWDQMQKIASSRPRLFKNQLEGLLNLLIMIFKNAVNMDTIKVSAMNFFSLLFTDMTQTMLNFEAQINEIVDQIVICMAIVPEEDFMDESTVEPTAEEDDNNDEMIDHISRRSEIVIDNMCCKAPEKMFTFVQKYASKFLGNPNAQPNEIIAGLNLICCAGEGCKKQYEQNLASIVSQVLPYIYNEKLHSKVRYTALTTIGQMCTDFRGSLIKISMPQISQAYAKALVICSSPNSQAQAFAALNNFIEQCPDYLAVQAMNDFIPAYKMIFTQKLLSKVKKNVLDSVISFSVFSQIAPQFYEVIREPLMSWVAKAETDKDPHTQSKILYAISSIGQNASKEVFAPDANAIMERFVAITRALNEQRSAEAAGAGDSVSEMEIDLTLVINTCTILLKTFEKSFAPFSEFMCSLGADCIKRGMTHNIFESLAISEDMPEQFNYIDSEIEEAINACEMLSTICEIWGTEVFDTMKELFPTLVTAIGNNKNIYLTLPAFGLISSIVKIAKEESKRQVWNQYAILVNQCFTVKDLKSEVFNGIADYLAETIKAYDESFLDDEFLNITTNAIKLGLKYDEKCVENRALQKHYEQDEEFVDYDIYNDSLDTEEDSYLAGIGILTKAMFGKCPNRYGTYFEQYKQGITKYLLDTQTYAEADIEDSLHVWSDIVKDAPDSIITQNKDLIKQMMEKYIMSDNLKHYIPAVFSIGVLAERRLGFDALITATLQRLIAFSSQQESRGVDDDVDSALDNTFSALIRIIRHAPATLGTELSKLTTYVLAYLPFEADLEELENCYEFIGALLQNTPDVRAAFGPESLTRVFLILIDAFVIAEGHISKELMARVITFTQKMYLTYTSEFQQVLAGVDEYKRNVFNAAVAKEGN